MRWSASLVLAIGCLCVAINVDAQESNPTGVARFHFDYGDVVHTAIEDRIGAFQADTKLPASMSMLMSMGVGSSRSNNYGEAEFAYVFSSGLEFLDQDHYIEIQEWYAALWYRRFVPLFYGLNLAPGAAVGYSWARANLGKEGPASGDSEDELGASTTVLRGSDVMFAVGTQVEIQLLEWGTGETLYLNFDYRYRLKRRYNASTNNDGDIFFPGGSEFEFDGHYYGIGVLVRIPNLSATPVD